MRLEVNCCGSSILEPMIQSFGWTRTLQGCQSALGLPPELVTELSEVRRVVNQIGGTPCD